MCAGRHSVIQGRSGRAKAWQSMRALRTFTIQDLVVTAEMSLVNARGYVGALHQAGYLRSSGKPPNRVFRLVKDTGPKPPRVRDASHVVYDPNLDQEVRPDG